MQERQKSKKKSPILIIDDDTAQLKTISDILETEKLQPFCCATGKEALKLCKKQEINVVILDLRLPDIDGLDLLKKLKKQNPQVKVIVNTGYASLESAMSAINEEAFAYVRKMGNVNELLAHIHRAFHTHLKIHSEKLEQEVRKRTADLLKSNQELKKEITERQRIENELRDSEKRFKQLSTASFEGIAIHDHGIILDANQTFAEMFGYQLTEVIGKSALDFAAPESRDIIFKNINSKTENPYEATGLRKNGSTFTGEIVGKQIPYKDRLCRVTAIRDISERKHLQKELARAQRLETAGRVAGQIAHDFNNLLSPLAAYPTLIREELPKNQSVVKMVDEIEFAANKIAEINQQLLALGRRGHYRMEITDLNDLVQKVVLSQNLPNNLVIREELASDLILINCGPAQLTRALINLITNARQAMRKGGVLTL